MKKAERNIIRFHAFTLIELLITIGIIIILIGVSTPQVLSYINRTKNTRAQMDMNTIKTSLQAYYHDWGTYPATLTELTINEENTENCASNFTINGIEGPVEYIKTIPNDIFIGQNDPQAYAYAVSTNKNDFIIWTNGVNHEGLTAPVFSAETQLFDLSTKDADDIIILP